MKILQTVTVKQVLTEESRETLLDGYAGKKLQLKKECDQLLFELKKLEKNKKYPTQTLRAHFEKEIGFREEKIKLVDFQIDQLNLLPLGSELKEKEIQALVDINVGDSWDSFTDEKIILVQDGIITEIRER